MPGKLTNLRENICQNVNKTPFQSVEDYIQVNGAGVGITTEVRFCVLRDAVSSARSDKHGSRTHASRTLLKKLIVVKKPCKKERHHVSNDIAILKALQASSTGDNARSSFFQLLAWDRVSPSPTWIATSTFPICCTLDHFRELGSMPEAFLWIVYTQMHAGLDFLHNVCKPPVVHGDLHLSNIIVGFQDPVHLGLPQVKLIDFGGSQLCSGETVTNNATVDIRELISTLDFTFHEGDCAACGLQGRAPPLENRSETFDNFHQDKVEANLYAFSVTTMFLQELWRKFGGFATMRAASICEASKKRMQDAIMREFEPQKVVVEARLNEIIDESANSLSL